MEPPFSKFPKAPQATLIAMLLLSVGLAFQFSGNFQELCGLAY
jgi:hypothetical protein